MVASGSWGVRGIDAGLPGCWGVRAGLVVWVLRRRRGAFEDLDAVTSGDRQDVRDVGFAGQWRGLGGGAPRGAEVREERLESARGQRHEEAGVARAGVAVAVRRIGR